MKGVTRYLQDHYVLLQNYACYYEEIAKEAKIPGSSLGSGSASTRKMVCMGFSVSLQLKCRLVMFLL